MEPLFFRPIPFKAIWGGASAKLYFGYEWMPEGTGQVWAFAAQRRASNVCMSDPFKGKTLAQLWKTEPELFGKANREFPLIVSLLCPCDRLSVQVHPDDEHARELGFQTGKNEAWYVLEADERAEIQYGHNAVDKRQLREYLNENRWSKLLRYIKVCKDDLIYIPAGLLHACGANVIIYEVQQSTDITYRLYDYDRCDQHGAKRELQVERAISCLRYGSDLNVARHSARVAMAGGCTRTTYGSTDPLVIEKLRIERDLYCLHESSFELISVVRGAGFVNETPIGVGSHFLVPRNTPVAIQGCLTCMMATA